MKKIYSKEVPEILLHQIIRLEEITPGKIELSDPKEFLQIMALNEERGKEYYPHKHLLKKGDEHTITQESWIVIKGKLKGTFYDLNGELLDEEILAPGDCSITFQGGHSLLVLEENTIFYEIKSGPYRGKEYDKTTI